MLKASTSSNCCEGCPELSPLMLGAIITSQTRSIQGLKLSLGSATMAGSDLAILVSADPTGSKWC